MSPAKKEKKNDPNRRGDKSMSTHALRARGKRVGLGPGQQGQSAQLNNGTLIS